MISNPVRRRVARNLCATLAAMSALMLGLTVWTTIDGASTPASAAAAGASLEAVTPTSGDSATQFTLGLPDGAACPGDSASGNYRVRTYLVPEAAAPATLTFDALGPVATEGQFRTALYNAATGESVAEALTNVAVGGGPGLITGLPFFTFGLFAPGEVPAGTYNIGIACTLGNPGPDQLTNYWNARVAITANPEGGPAQLSWEVLEGSGPTTTSTTVDGSSTTTVVDDTTTTSAGDGSTTTVADGSTTTSVEGGSTTTASVAGSGLDFSGGSPSAASPVSTLGQLPYTGGSPVPMIVWGVLLVVFGRMAMLLGRRPKVRPSS